MGRRLVSVGLTRLAVVKLSACPYSGAYGEPGRHDAK